MKMFVLRMPDDLHEVLRKMAFDKRVSMASIIVGSLNEKFNSRNMFSASEDAVKKEKVNG